ncbi:MAG: hypothetical protein ACTSWN_07045 [Promethearchaeota archaeon]
MSRRITPFKAMLERLAKATLFDSTGDKLKNALIEEYTRKRKNHPYFKNMLKRIWKKYPHNKVAKILLDNYEQIFNFWFTRMFYFDKSRLKILEPNMRSDVDFNAKFQYLYKKDEIEFIESLLEKYNITKTKPIIIMNQLILFGLRALGPIIEENFGRPYDFQPEGISGEDSNEGRKVTIFFSCREA